MRVNFRIEKQFRRNIDIKKLMGIINRAEDILEFKEVSEITIAILGNDKMLELNSRYRKTDTTTDVLSFSSNEIDPESGNRYLGDIILSFPQAFQQAEEFCHNVNDEISQLIIHGLLHLSGYDHQNKSDETRMFAMQENILKEIENN